VLACGGEADARLYAELAGQRPDVHLLGDAFAPAVWSPRPARRTP
jgi:hypothetical protein